MQSTINYTQEDEARTLVHPNYSSSLKTSIEDINSSISLISTIDESEFDPKLIHQKISVKTTTEEKPITRMQKFKKFMRLMRPTFEMLFFDIGLPLAIYFILKIWASALIALIVSGIPPLLRVIYFFWKKRKVDVLGCMFLISFTISAVLSGTTGDVRLALFRDSITTAVVSLLFFVSLIPLHTKWFTIRPVIFIFAREMMSAAEPIKWTDIEGEEHNIQLIDWNWKECSIFRKYCYTLCFLWGFMLMSEFVTKVIMIQSPLTVDQIILYSFTISIGVLVVVTIASTIASILMQKKINIIFKKWQKENDFTEKFSK